MSTRVGRTELSETVERLHAITRGQYYQNLEIELGNKFAFVQNNLPAFQLPRLWSGISEICIVSDHRSFLPHP